MPKPRGLLPGAVVEVADALRHSARGGEHQGEHVLRHRLTVGPRGDADRDAAIGRRLDIDAVVAHPGANDDLEPVGRRDVGGIQRAGAGDDRPHAGEKARTLVVGEQIRLGLVARRQSGGVELSIDLVAGVQVRGRDEDVDGHQIPPS
jgi:hypothetical protein